MPSGTVPPKRRASVNTVSKKPRLLPEVMIRKEIFPKYRGPSSTSQQSDLTRKKRHDAMVQKLEVLAGGAKMYNWSVQLTEW
ncbi:hypothetical protein GEMRC1_013986 [Eukaryota sp. GEM-RC1]